MPPLQPTAICRREMEMLPIPFSATAAAAETARRFRRRGTARAAPHRWNASVATCTITATISSRPDTANWCANAVRARVPAAAAPPRRWVNRRADAVDRRNFSVRTAQHTTSLSVDVIVTSLPAAMRNSFPATRPTAPPEGITFPVVAAVVAAAVRAFSDDVARRWRHRTPPTWRRPIRHTWRHRIPLIWRRWTRRTCSRRRRRFWPTWRTSRHCLLSLTLELYQRW